ncbi:hypothetical protein B9Z55_007784 [Caenorhabditis nigoni]|uniref:BTB domain-containing protein n=1 Tax=Caenorhabditis nigoni TaxID=1611254 RepID=A0A2G5VB72_9PELO|nr:hypothetical protein B9Z55_007784 [Caenorhabditis nigoni]
MMFRERFKEDRDLDLEFYRSLRRSPSPLFRRSPPPLTRLLERKLVVEEKVVTKQNEPFISKCEKEVELKHVFKNVISLKERSNLSSKWEERFNVKWKVEVSRHNNVLDFNVYCEPITSTKKWSIRTKTQLKVVGRNKDDITVTQEFCYEDNNRLTFDDFLEYEKMEKDYLVDGNLIVEAKVEIVETTGLKKEKIRKFDESKKDVSDVVLTVNDTKFYVSKLHLASQSSVLKSLLLEKSSVSDKLNVELKGIDPNDFHSFLEVLYGESTIDDSNVEEMLLLAEKFDAPTVKRRCEEFLLKESKKTIEIKCEMANRYHLENMDFECTIENDTKVNKITMKHVFKDVLKIEEKVEVASGWKESFNVKWNTSLKRRYDQVGLYVQCKPIIPADKWSIQTKIELKVIGRNQKDLTLTQEFCYEDNNQLTFDDFLEWGEMEKDYLVNGNLNIETKLTIIETTGLRKAKIRKFDESQKDVSDVVLVVRNGKFYVSKKYLASQSAHFKSLFIENPTVSNKPEIALPGIDPDDFHYFLEVLYGESAIDDSNVEQVLFLAEKFDAPTVKRRCEEYIMKESKKTFGIKLRLANRYCLKNKNFSYATANVNPKVKQFMMKHVFKNVPSFKELLHEYSEWEEHFNVKWMMDVKRNNNHLGFYVHCEPITPSDKWSIQARIELKVVGSNQNDVIETFDYCYEKSTGRGFSSFLEWDKMEKEYLVDGNLTVEAKVTIVKSSGLGIKKIRKFDESEKDVSDVTLVVSGTKFYVSKMLLASQSSVLKSLLFEKSSSSNKSEVELTGIDPNDFHAFLEVLYGESTIDESNVEQILLLADSFDASTIKRRCEEFLLKDSKKTSERNLKNKNSECAAANVNPKVKQFVLKNVFKNVAEFTDGIDNRSEWEDHFNIYWSMTVKRFKNHLAFHVYCDPMGSANKWSLQTEFELKVVGGTQKDVTGTHGYCFERRTSRGFNQFLKWEKMEEKYLVDGNLTVEAKVTIIETTGLGTEKVRKFDESQKDCSDVILLVRSTKFFVSKMYLAAHSTFFKTLFSGKSAESKKSEMTLTEIDPHDFHHFLDLLYGESDIDDSTVEGILLVADKYETPMIVRKCTEFLVRWSRKGLKKKLEQAVKYNFEELKKECISEIETVADVRKVLEDNIYGLNSLIIEELFDKSLYLN